MADTRKNQRSTLFRLFASLLVTAVMAASCTSSTPNTGDSTQGADDTGTGVTDQTLVGSQPGSASSDISETGPTGPGILEQARASREVADRAALIDEIDSTDPLLVDLEVALSEMTVEVESYGTGMTFSPEAIAGVLEDLSSDYAYTVEDVAMLTANLAPSGSVTSDLVDSVIAVIAPMKVDDSTGTTSPGGLLPRLSPRFTPTSLADVADRFKIGLDAVITTPPEWDWNVPELSSLMRTIDSEMSISYEYLENLVTGLPPDSGFTEIALEKAVLFNDSTWQVACCGEHPEQVARSISQLPQTPLIADEVFAGLDSRWLAIAGATSRDDAADRIAALRSLIQELRWDLAAAKWETIELSGPQEDDGKITALVLEGGGGKGAFQVGVLKYLYNVVGINPDIICGTSVGALNGAMLAQGWRSLPLPPPGRAFGGVVQGPQALENVEEFWVPPTSDLEKLWRSIDGPWEIITPNTKFWNNLDKFAEVAAQSGGLTTLVKLVGLTGFSPKDEIAELKKQEYMFDNEPLRRLVTENLKPAVVAASGIKLRVHITDIKTGLIWIVDEAGRVHFDDDQVSELKASIETWNAYWTGQDGASVRDIQRIAPLTTLDLHELAPEGITLDLIDAVVASSSIPVAFPPLPQGEPDTTQPVVPEIDLDPFSPTFGEVVEVEPENWDYPHLLYDGGILRNLPIETCLEENPDEMIIVLDNVFLGLETWPPEDRKVKVPLATYSARLWELIYRQKGLREAVSLEGVSIPTLTIGPPFLVQGLLDFGRQSTALNIWFGEQTARRVLQGGVVADLAAASNTLEGNIASSSVSLGSYPFYECVENFRTIANISDFDEIQAEKISKWPKTLRDIFKPKLTKDQENNLRQAKNQAIAAVKELGCPAVPGVWPDAGFPMAGKMTQNAGVGSIVTAFSLLADGTVEGTTTIEKSCSTNSPGDCNTLNGEAAVAFYDDQGAFVGMTDTVEVNTLLSPQDKWTSPVVTSPGGGAVILPASELVSIAGYHIFHAKAGFPVNAKIPEFEKIVSWGQKNQDRIKRWR